MNYILVNHEGAAFKYPYGLHELRQDNPNTSFPSEMSDDALVEWNVFPCHQDDEPQVSSREYAKLMEPQLVDGQWRISWSVEPITDDDWKIKAEYQWADVRAERNSRLAASDWTQLADAPVDSKAWADYRQALRDITLQNDPFNIDWPQHP